MPRHPRRLPRRPVLLVAWLWIAAALAVGVLAVAVDAVVDHQAGDIGRTRDGGTEVGATGDGHTSTTAVPAGLAPLVGAGPRVVVLADSNGIASRQPFLAATVARWTTSFNAVGHTHMANGGLAWTAAAARLEPDAVVVALATNDSLWLAPTTDPLPVWHQAMDNLAGQCTVVVLPYRGATPEDPRHLWVPRIAELVASLGARLVDFGAVVEPGDVAADDLHLTEAGQQRYTELLVAAADECV